MSSLIGNLGPAQSASGVTSGSAVRNPSMLIPVESDVLFPSAAGTFQSGGVSIVKFFEFDNAQDAQTVLMHATAPKGIDAAIVPLTLTYFLVTTVVGAGDNEVVMEITDYAASSTDTLSFAGATVQNVVSSITNTAGKILAVTASLDFGGLVADDEMIISMRRLGTHASDDFTGKVGILSNVRLEYRLTS